MESVDRQNGDLPCRVLVVDDDPVSRDLLRPVLEAEGWAVDVAEDGQAGLRRVAEAPPDLILLDLMMPGINGFEVAAELHRNEAWRSIPVVVMTAKDLTDEDRQRLNGLVARVLQKGSDGTAGLLQAVHDITSIWPVGGTEEKKPEASSQKPAEERQAAATD